MVRLDASLSACSATREMLRCSVGVGMQGYWSEKKKKEKKENLGQPLLDKPLQTTSPGAAINRLLQVSAQKLPSQSLCCGAVGVSEINLHDFRHK